ncbi:MAG: hypothetical protein QOE87_2458 [Gaiellales bacterium]|nr:hypothetical protein [Gaiellales bacterium]
MINRLLRLRREPASIFEHIDAHVQPGVAGLAEGGRQLPDDGEIVAVVGDAEAAEAAVERIYAALVTLAAKPNAMRHQRVRRLFREGDVRGRIDALRDRLGADPPAHADRLYPELHEIFLQSGYRDEVKYAMALMSGFGRREDADLFRIVGRHEEFTLYAAVALATVSDDPLRDWLELLPLVEGWGRIELAELILREPLPQAARERLLGDAAVAGNPLVAAGDAALRSPDPLHRLVALRALSSWEHVPAELVELVAAARADDSDERVREHAAQVLAGERILDP